MPTKHKAIKCRIYPSKGQEEKIVQTFGCCRKVWNLMLNEKEEYYKENNTYPKVTPAKYKTEYPFLKKVDSLALANEQLHLERAFNNYFNKISKYPRYKSKKRRKQSYTTNNVNNNIKLIDGKYIKLPKLGLIKIKQHRRPNDDWKLKGTTVSRDSDGNYYASLLFEFEEAELNNTLNLENSIGLDYKSDGFYADSNGEVKGSPKYYRKSQKKLSKEQRRLSKKVGNKKKEDKSKNYLKQLNKVNKIYVHCKNQRKDFLHKTSTAIAKQYDFVFVEDINMKDLSNKGFRNGKATMDNGWGMFINMLDYKLKDRNKVLIKVDKWYPSSQICHICGYQNEEVKDLSIREWTCPICGNTHQRDYNAAVNIKKEGIRLYQERYPS